MARLSRPLPPYKFRPLRTALLIPTRGRPDVLAKAFQREPLIYDMLGTYIGIEHKEWHLYESIFKATRRVQVIKYDNPEGSVGIAREALRRAAISKGYEWYVATDDNAKFTVASFNGLVQSAEAWMQYSESLTLVAGMHSVASHFDRERIKRKETIDGWTTYPGINFIYHAMPHAWYKTYQYPGDCFALEDRHMMLSAIDRGLTEFRICMDAPFQKARYQRGGQGDLEKRRWNCGRSIERLAHDFPTMVGSRGTFPLPWQFILDLRQGAKPNRLMGGAMRKAEVMTLGDSPRLRIRRRQL